jgi:hypothetical protein
MGDHVFICYSRRDENFVIKLATNLKRLGVPVWLDQWDIPIGANWNRTIQTALNECSRLLLVLSPSSVESDDVECEWLSALDMKKVVIPILYQPCNMPFRLKLIQYIDFTSRSLDDEKSLEHILEALGKAKRTKNDDQPQKPIVGLRDEPSIEKAKYAEIATKNTKTDRASLNIPSNGEDARKSILEFIEKAKYAEIATKITKTDRASLNIPSNGEDARKSILEFIEKAKCLDNDINRYESKKKPWWQLW